jgi:uncharacterized protein (DUF302 family)
MKRLTTLLLSLWALSAGAQQVPQPTPEQMKQMHEAAAKQFMLMSAMFHTKHSRLGFDETLAAIRDGAGKRGWILGAVQDVQATMQQQGIRDAKRMKVIFLCPKDANERLAKASGGKSPALPCRVTVFEDKTGEVHFMRMNTSAMAKLVQGGEGLSRLLTEIGAEEDALYKGLTKD